MRSKRRTSEGRSFSPVRSHRDANSSSSLLQHARQLAASGRPSEAEAMVLPILRSQPAHFEANLFLGTLYLDQKKLDRATRHLERAVQASPHHPLARGQLGLACELSGQRKEACRHYLQINQADPANLPWVLRSAHAHLGLGDHSTADRLYEEVLRLEPSLAEAWHGRADIARQKGDETTALHYYQQAVDASPDFLPSLCNLGLLAQHRGEWERARIAFERALDIAPETLPARTGLAVTFGMMGTPDIGMDHAIVAHRQQPNHPLVHECFALLYGIQGMKTQAIESWRQAVEARPDSIRYRLILAQKFADNQQPSQAIEQYRAVRQRDPSQIEAVTALAQIDEQADRVREAQEAYQSLGRAHADQREWWMLRSSSVVPTILTNEEEIDEIRDQINNGLVAIEAIDRPIRLEQLASIGAMPPFALQFHHQDDRVLRERYSSAVRRALRLPDSTGPAPSQRSRPRVAFACWHNPRAFVRSIGALIGLLNTDRLEPIVLGVEATSPLLRKGFASTGIPVWVLPSQPERIVDRLRSADLDLLVHFEVGTTPLGYLLAHHRLARTQVATWGVQITSGVREIDYYLSSDLVEPQGAETQYTERLIRAQSLLSVQPLPTVDHVSPYPWPFPRTGSIYLCPQQLGKFTPGFDALLQAILVRDPSGTIVITKGTGDERASRLRERWTQTMPEVVSRIQWVPQAMGDDYWSLLKSADVLLDPIHFGGVNTTYDALAVGKVIVTLPSFTQRTRYTTACYQVIRIHEPIAESADDYVDKAVTLARDAQLRRSIEQMILSRQSDIFVRKDAACEAERILLMLTRGEFLQ